jgi:hypothetical protein
MSQENVFISVDAMIAMLEQLGPDQSRRGIWLVEYRNWESDPRGRLKLWLEEHGHPRLAHSWTGIDVVRYEIEPATLR